MFNDHKADLQAVVIDVVPALHYALQGALGGRCTSNILERQHVNMVIGTVDPYPMSTENEVAIKTGSVDFCTGVPTPVRVSLRQTLGYVWCQKIQAWAQRLTDEE